MGTISYWMSEPSSLAPGSVDEALRRSGLELWHEDGEWVVIVSGFPIEWHRTREAAEESVSHWARPWRPASVEHVPGGTWLVMSGDQYYFSSPSREEAEGFVHGVLVGNAFAHIGEPNWLASPPADA